MAAFVAVALLACGGGKSENNVKADVSPSVVALTLYNGLTSGDVKAVTENIYFKEQLDYNVFRDYFQMAVANADYKERTKNFKADSKGYAVVEGEHTYEVTFTYQDGIVSNLFCDCPCTFTCKHEFATMLQLRETLELIEKHYANEYARSRYFAAIVKGVLLTLAIDGKETGNFTL